MSGLEPTSTYSNPTATERIRAMLDELGVEWHYTKIGKGFITVYEHDGITWIVTEHSSGRLSVKGCVNPTQGHYDGMTPEQAIAATLGSCNCSDNCTNSERTETCHPVISDNLTESEGTGDAWADCSECGHLLFVLTDPNSQVPNFCPNCGAKVVEPTTNDVDAEVDA